MRPAIRGLFGTGRPSFAFGCRSLAFLASFCASVSGVGDPLIGRDPERLGGLSSLCGLGSPVGLDRSDIAASDSGEPGWLEVRRERLLIRLAFARSAAEDAGRIAGGLPVGKKTLLYDPTKDRDWSSSGRKQSSSS